jgi:hypothetical protein
MRRANSIVQVQRSSGSELCWKRCMQQSTPESARPISLSLSPARDWRGVAHLEHHADGASSIAERFQSLRCCAYESMGEGPRAIRAPLPAVVGSVSVSASQSRVTDLTLRSPPPELKACSRRALLPLCVGVTVSARAIVRAPLRHPAWRLRNEAEQQDGPRECANNVSCQTFIFVPL